MSHSIPHDLRIQILANMRFDEWYHSSIFRQLNYFDLVNILLYHGVTNDQITRWFPHRSDGIILDGFIKIYTLMGHICPCSKQYLSGRLFTETLYLSNLDSSMLPHGLSKLLLYLFKFHVLDLINTDGLRAIHYKFPCITFPPLINRKLSASTEETIRTYLTDRNEMTRRVALIYCGYFGIGAVDRHYIDLTDYKLGKYLALSEERQLTPADFDPPNWNRHEINLIQVWFNVPESPKYIEPYIIACIKLGKVNLIKRFDSKIISDVLSMAQPFFWPDDFGYITEEVIHNYKQMHNFILTLPQSKGRDNCLAYLQIYFDQENDYIEYLTEGVRSALKTMYELISLGNVKQLSQLLKMGKNKESLDFDRRHFQNPGFSRILYHPVETIILCAPHFEYFFDEYVSILYYSGKLATVYDQLMNSDKITPAFKEKISYRFAMGHTL